MGQGFYVVVIPDYPCMLYILRLSTRFVDVALKYLFLQMIMSSAIPDPCPISSLNIFYSIRRKAAIDSTYTPI